MPCFCPARASGELDRYQGDPTGGNGVQCQIPRYDPGGTAQRRGHGIGGHPQNRCHGEKFIHRWNGCDMTERDAWSWHICGWQMGDFSPHGMTWVTWDESARLLARPTRTSCHGTRPPPIIMPVLNKCSGFKQIVVVVTVSRAFWALIVWRGAAPLVLPKSHFKQKPYYLSFFSPYFTS